MAGADAREAEGDAIASVVVAGLSRTPKMLPPRLFYDRRGSELFERITELEEYYPTRAETAILETNAAAIVSGVSPGSLMIELGSGSSRKTEILLGALPSLRAYVPVDVSESALEAARARLAARFPDLDVRPVRADFAGPVELPSDLARLPRLGFFPGSTIGNLTPDEARALLARLGGGLLRGGRLVVGVDLRKDRDRLERAYDDAAGVTAAFNLNVLARINREVAPAFDLTAFAHRAFFNDSASRIEMHLESRRRQEIELGGHTFRFEKGETIHTESSYKYSLEAFQALACEAGWEPRRTWTDRELLFSVHELVSGG